MRVLVGLLAAMVTAGPVLAAELSVSVRTPEGRPVADAVATVEPAAGAGAGGGPIHFDWPYRMAQHNQMFDPFVLIVPVGAQVSFPNRDPVRHQVYSFSPAHPFELKLYGRDESRTVRFDRAGVVALGCNIHDNMVAFIRVVDTPWAAKSDAAGHALIRNLPAGPAVLRIWRPYVKAPGNEVSREIVLPRDGSLSQAFILAVRAPPMVMDRY